MEDVRICQECCGNGYIEHVKPGEDEVQTVDCPNPGCNGGELQ